MASLTSILHVRGIDPGTGCASPSSHLTSLTGPCSTCFPAVGRHNKSTELAQAKSFPGLIPDHPRVSEVITSFTTYVTYFLLPPPTHGYCSNDEKKHQGAKNDITGFRMQEQQHPSVAECYIDMLIMAWLVVYSGSTRFKVFAQLRTGSNRGGIWSYIPDGSKSPEKNIKPCLIELSATLPSN